MTDQTGAGVPAEGVTPEISALIEGALDGLPQPDSRFERDRWRIASKVALTAALPAIAAQAAAAERELLLAQLREFLPRYVGIVIHTCTPDGTPVYATGPVGFPDALVDTFALMTVPDADLLGQDAP